MAGETCAGYVRPSNFKPWPSELKGNDGFYKSEAWPYWVSALNVKLEVGSFFAPAQSILSPPEYANFNARFQKMREDFDRRYLTVEGYGNFTNWCKYLTEGMTWDTQFKLFRTEMKAAISRAEEAATTVVRTEANAAPAERKAAEAKATTEAKRESTPAAKKKRRETTEVAVETAGGNTTSAAENLARAGQTAGTVSGMSPMDIALWVGGGVLALGVLWSFLPDSKGGTSPAVATAGLGRSGRRHRRRR